jgi:hypothetical protein
MLEQRGDGGVIRLQQRDRIGRRGPRGLLHVVVFRGLDAPYDPKEAPRVAGLFLVAV